MLITCVVGVTNVLDLRAATARIIGLSIDILTSPTRDREAYQRCQQVAAVAQHLGLHGLITPAATKIGHTLALFTQNRPISERPEQIAEEIWTQLPPDPRGHGRGQLRVVRPPSD